MVDNFATKTIIILECPVQTNSDLGLPKLGQIMVSCCEQFSHYLNKMAFLRMLTKCNGFEFPLDTTHIQ